MLDFFGKPFVDGCRVKMDGVGQLLNCRTVNGEFYIFSSNANMKITADLVQSHKLQITESYRIRANQELFLEMSAICNGFKTLSNVVENDMTVDPEVVQKWQDVFELNLKDLLEWKAKMEKHIGIVKS